MPLYDRGYDKDPTNVAAEAMRQAQRDGVDVVLVDTAGRMQDNEPLMRALSMLINKNRPDLVLFVGEALVGNDGATRLTRMIFSWPMLQCVHVAGPVCACCGPWSQMESPGAAAYFGSTSGQSTPTDSTAGAAWVSYALQMLGGCI